MCTSTYPWRFSIFIIIVRGTPPQFHCSTGPQMPVMETINEVRPLPGEGERGGREGRRGEQSTHRDHVALGE